MIRAHLPVSEVLACLPGSEVQAHLPGSEVHVPLPGSEVQARLPGSIVLACIVMWFKSMLVGASGKCLCVSKCVLSTFVAPAR